MTHHTLLVIIPLTSLGRDRSRFIRLAWLWGKRLARVGNNRSSQPPHLLEDSALKSLIRFGGELRNELGVIFYRLIQHAPVAISDDHVKLPVGLSA